MAVVSVTAQNTRLDDASTTTDWGNIGGGAGGATETDYSYQGSSCFSRKGASGQRGIFLSDAVDTDVSTATGTYQTIMVKCIVTTPGLLDLLSVPGMTLRIGSGSTPASASSNYYQYDIHGSDTYPIDKSWLVVPIDPNIASHRTSTTGSPSLTTYDFTALLVDQTAVSKAENYALDAVDVGAGLTLVGGDGADPDGTFQDLSDHDWGTSSNRYGYVREAEGVFLMFGRMILGTATATVFTDSNQTVVFPDGLFATGFSGITCDLQNASTVIDLGNCTLIGKGTSTGEDTRPDLTVTGTGGSLTFEGNIQNFRSVTFTSVCTITNAIIECETLTQASCDISDTTIITTSATDVATLQDPTFGTTTDLHDVVFTQGGAGHAVEISTAGTYNFTNLTFNGYGADTTNSAALDITASSGTVTINVTGGNTPTYKTAGATVDLVLNPVTTKVTVLDASDQSAIQNVRVYLRPTDNTGDLPYEESVSITRSGSTATVTHTGHGLSSNQYVDIQGADQQEYNGAKQITVSDANTYTVTVTGTPTTPATGTIISTGLAVSGVTDVNGEISDSRAYSAAQDVEGWARHVPGSGVYYKTFPLVGTISNVNGLELTALMQDDGTNAS